MDILELKRVEVGEGGEGSGDRRFNSLLRRRLSVDIFKFLVG